MIDPITTGVEAASTGIAVYEMAKKQGWSDKLFSAIRRQNRVIVLGETGTGKTQFISSLDKCIPPAINRINRTFHVTSKKMKFNGERFLILDTPGQKGQDSKRNEAIRSAVSQKFVGVIDVVSYGYHEARISTGRAITQSNQVNPDFLNECREKESALFSQWVSVLGSGVKGPWLITLVNKADLWWDDMDTVISYYSQGRYAELAKEYFGTKPAVVPYCSTMKKFYDKAPMAPSFDQDVYHSLRSDFTCQILTAIGKSA